jgi:hypothetical protein
MEKMLKDKKWNAKYSESINESGMGILDKDQTDVLHAIVMRNKNKNSNSILKIALKDRMFKGIDKRELLGYIEGAKQFVRYMKSHSMESVNESRYNVKKAIKIAKKMGGNMTGAVKKIEKIQKGLSKQIEVEDALRKANESVNERMDKRQGTETLKQLGGNKFIAMTGAKDFGVGPKGMSFKIGRNSKRVNYIRIDLKNDLYNMEFMWVSKRGVKVVKKVKGVYNDQLQKVFTKYTGMYTRL